MKKITGTIAHSTTRKGAFKEVMKFIWSLFFETEFRKDFGEEAVTVESITLREHKFKGGTYDLEVEINTAFSYEEQMKLFCDRCRNYGGLGFSPSKPCESCQLYKFAEHINKQLRKRSNVQKKKINQLINKGSDSNG